MIGVTQLKALKVGRNGPTPKSFLGAERGAFGAPLRPQSPQGNELRKSDMIGQWGF